MHTNNGHQRNETKLACDLIVPNNATVTDFNVTNVVQLQMARLLPMLT